MGFGLLALGYVFLNFYTTGADLVGYIIMLIALYKLTKIEKSFKKSMFAVILLIPVGMYNLFGFVDTAFHLGIFRDHNYPIVSTETSNITDESNQSTEEVVDDSSEEKISEEKSEAEKKRNEFVKITEGIINAIFIFGSLCFHYFFYQSIRKLCIKTSSTKLGFKASRNMAINIAFFSIWGLLTAGGTKMTALNIVTVLHFVVLLLNFIYIYSCYATFAYESDVESDEKSED